MMKTVSKINLFVHEFRTSVTIQNKLEGEGFRRLSVCRNALPLYDRSIFRQSIQNCRILPVQWILQITMPEALSTKSAK